MIQFIPAIPARSRWTPEEYQRWLDRLKTGDEVLFQEFVRPSDNFCHFPFEHWRLTRGQVVRQKDGAFLFEGSERQHVRSDGKACFYDGQEWGSVFPARIVRFHPSILFLPDKTYTYGHAPIYEPLFVGQTRYTFLISHGLEYFRFAQAIEASCPYTYRRKVAEGILVICFAEEPPVVEGITPIYSEFLDP